MTDKPEDKGKAPKEREEQAAFARTRKAREAGRAARVKAAKGKDKPKGGKK
jgi:hypothetical protein